MPDEDFEQIRKEIDQACRRSEQTFTAWMDKKKLFSGNTLPNRLSFVNLPSLTLTIYLGLSRTRVGLFRPGTTEFVNIAEVENCLFYREGSYLVAFNDLEKQRLGTPDVNLDGILVDGPIDKLFDVKLDGQHVQVRNSVPNGYG